jgi:hypothetical protein
VADRVQGKVVIIVTEATSGSHQIAACPQRRCRTDQTSSCSSLTGSLRSRWPVA